MKNTIVVTIGRNIGDTPMLPLMWQQFKADVLYVLNECHADVIQRPHIVSKTDALGCWEGAVCEEAAAFVAFIDDRDLNTPVPHLRKLAAKYSQDAIGWIVTSGTDNLIRPRALQYGDTTDTGHVVGV